MTMPVLLILVIGFMVANPFPNSLDNQLIPQVQKSLLLSMENHLDTTDENPNKINERVKNINKTLSTVKYTNIERLKTHSEIHDNESNEKETIQARKHKAIFVDYPLISYITHYPSMPMYDVNKDNSDITKNRSSGVSKKYQESDIFYVRLPPIPYVFVSGLEYISQPPTYSTTALKSQMSFVPQLSHVRPVRPQPASQYTVNRFIKLPMDFVSNGKPISVYQWQKQSDKKPADSSITNLDNLSADFVSNGKPTSIYQWQANIKPAKRPEDSLNSLNMGLILSTAN